MREVDAALDANEDTLREHGEWLKKQDAKLAEHDRWFAELDRDLETLKNLHQAQMDHIDDTLRRLRMGMNGR